MNYQNIINRLSVKDFYLLSIEDQGHITQTIIAVCKMHFKTGDSISVAVRKTIKETHFQKRLVDTIVQASHEIRALVKEAKIKRDKIRQSCPSTIQLGSLNANR